MVINVVEVFTKVKWAGNVLNSSFVELCSCGNQVLLNFDLNKNTVAFKAG